MGHEFRIKTIPFIEDIRQTVVLILGPHEQIIDSSLLAANPEKLGIASETSIGTDWPHCCDLMVEETGVIYAIAHNGAGYQIITKLVQHLKANGCAVEVDDDI
jgi:hypothetical protein